MRFLEKYLLLLYLIANATAEYLALMFLSKYLFYAVLALSLPLIFSRGFFSNRIRRQCSYIYVLMVIYVIAQFVFQTDLMTSENVLFTIGKVVTLCIMMLCISTNFEMYFKSIILPFSYGILGLLLVGWFHNKTGVGMDDYIVFGFTNRNAACILGAISFAGILFSKEKFSYTDYACMAFLLVTILVGGSRNALAMCFMFILIRFGFSIRLIAASFICIVSVLYIFPGLGIEATALERLEGSLTGVVSLDREDERNAAIWMIQQRPWSGWGYNHVNYGYAASLTEYGAHNGYLTTLENLGIPLGILWILTVLIGTLKSLKLYRLHDKTINYHLAVVIAILFSACFEDFLVGVNQIITNVFFVSFAVLGIYRYKYGYSKQSY